MNLHTSVPFRPALLLAALVLLGACSRGPLTVTAVQVGKSVNSDSSVAVHSTSFKPADTVFAAALSAGSGSGELTARWSFNGRQLSEESRRVSYTKDAATAFHLQYPAGLPPGDYTVEMLVDGRPAGERTFRVSR